MGLYRPTRPRQSHRHGPVVCRDRVRDRAAGAGAVRRCWSDGIGAIGPAIFTQMTPPPGSSGGLLNAIFGSLMMAGIATAIGTPTGILAGTFLAEYARGHWFGEIVRFVNDILLSAPSIIIGLFVYEVMVVRMGHFSAWAGAVALAIIVVPVVVRTTEDMLRPGAERAARGGGGARRAEMEGHRDDRLPRRGAGHADRRAARGRAHFRRDRAAAVHRAQQPVLEHRSQRADGQSAGRHLPVRDEPLCRLAGARLGRRAADHRGGPRSSTSRPESWPPGAASSHELRLARSINAEREPAALAASPPPSRAATRARRRADSVRKRDAPPARRRRSRSISATSISIYGKFKALKGSRCRFTTGA